MGNPRAIILQPVSDSSDKRVVVLLDRDSLPILNPGPEAILATLDRSRSLDVELVPQDRYYLFLPKALNRPEPRDRQDRQDRQDRTDGPKPLTYRELYRALGITKIAAVRVLLDDGPDLTPYPAPYPEPERTR